jgi:hypothetical protein
VEQDGQQGARTDREDERLSVHPKQVCVPITEHRGRSGSVLDRRLVDASEQRVRAPENDHGSGKYQALMSRPSCSKLDLGLPSSLYSVRVNVPSSYVTFVRWPLPSYSYEVTSVSSPPSTTRFRVSVVLERNTRFEPATFALASW